MTEPSDTKPAGAPEPSEEAVNETSPAQCDQALADHSPALGAAGGGRLFGTRPLEQFGSRG